MSILHSEKAARIAVRSVAVSSVVLPRVAEDFEVVVGDALVGGAVSHCQPQTRTVMLSSKPLDKQR